MKATGSSNRLTALIGTRHSSTGSTAGPGSESNKAVKRILLIVLVLLIIAVPAWIILTAKSTAIKVDPPVTVIGFRTPVNVQLANPHGVRSAGLTVEQDGKSYPMNPPNSGKGARTFAVSVGKESIPALHDGKARLIVTAVSNDLRRK